MLSSVRNKLKEDLCGNTVYFHSVIQLANGMVWYANLMISCLLVGVLYIKKYANSNQNRLNFRGNSKHKSSEDLYLLTS